MSDSTASASAQVILILIDEVRPRTIQLLEAPLPEWLLWAPHGTQNHITWHAGHCAWLADVLCIGPVTGASELSPRWAETFGQDRTPPARTKNWPTVPELVAVLRAQHLRMRELVSPLSDDELARVVSPRSGATLARQIVHGLHDEACHQGEIYLLFKMRWAELKFI